jgi:hypothetical protein
LYWSWHWRHAALQPSVSSAWAAWAPFLAMLPQLP